MADTLPDPGRPCGPGLILVDDSAVITFTSRPALTLLGLDEDPTGQALDEFAAHVDCPSLDSSCRAVLRTRQPQEPVELATPAGTVVARPSPADTGAALILESLAGDDAATGGSRLREALYEQLLDGVRDAVLVTSAEPFDAPGPVILYANPAFTHHTGYPLQEVLGRSPRILQGPKTNTDELRRLRQAMERWQACTIEVLNYRKDGSEFWVEIDVSPLADETGWFTHWVSVQRDVTERRRADERRAEREAIVQTILDSLPAQTAMLAGDGRIVTVNEAWRRFWKEGSGAGEPDWSQINYLEACQVSAETGEGSEAEAAMAAYEGISGVVTGQADSFAIDYECWDGRRMRWFHLQAAPLAGRSGAVVTHLDITRRKEAEERLGYEATHDSLTGLPNRSLLTDHLAAQLDADRLAGHMTAVLFLDLDNFKDVNDAYGHAYGDQLLETLSARLTETVGEDGFVSRLGGDEWVVVLGGLDSDWDPQPFFANLRAVLREPVTVGLVALRPSISVGVVTSPPHAGVPAAILRDADTAMYASKRAGRDRWTLFTDEVRDSALARLLSEDRLAEALANDAFVLHFQPIVEVATGGTIGSEALLRLRQDPRRLLMPAEFLPAVESSTLVEEVGSWVIDHALEVQSRWQQRNPEHVMSINVSARQLGHGRLVGIVLAALERHGVEPGNVSIELTEESLLSAAGAAVGELEELQAAGVRIAIDDFGTGYSSLAYLGRLPVDVLKIDRAFLSEENLLRKGELLAAIAGLGRAVGAKLLAEGVETRHQWDLVQQAGITMAQGFLMGRPEPAGDAPVSAEPTG